MALVFCCALSRSTLATGTLVAFEYQTKITDQALRLTFDQVIDGTPVPPILMEAIRHYRPQKPALPTRPYL